jgi:hypothetical protein
MKPGPTTDPKDSSKFARGDEILAPVRAQERLYIALDCADAEMAPGKSRLFARYVPLLSWAVVLITLLLIPLKIIGYGFLAPGDARRHVAKAFTDKPYAEIIVMRPEYTMDHSPGWEWALSRLHRATSSGPDALMSFSVISMMLCVFLAPLPWLRRPEAWLVALLAQLIAIPELMTRLAQARPYLLTEGVMIALLFAWSRDETPSRLKLALTSLGIALSVWVHGAWYLWALPLVAFLFAGRLRAGLWLGCCIALGTVAGALLTGHPIEFLRQALLIAASISREHVPQWLLVGEFRPSYGEFATLVLVGLVFLWRRQQRVLAIATSNQKTSPQASAPEEAREPDTSLLKSSTVGGFSGPAFWLMTICWILGFKADRFWGDWGIPAVLVWLTLQFQAGMVATWNIDSPKRLLACGLLAIPLFLHATNDLDRRYTSSLGESFIDASEPSLQGWLPEPNGIFYTAHMDFFYNTFYKNPQGNWRYILGMEPALMPDPDLLIFRNIQLSQFSFKAYEPWVQKMTGADRLAILCSAQPPLPQLQWTNAVGDVWIGRLPGSKKSRN